MPKSFILSLIKSQVSSFYSKLKSSIYGVITIEEFETIFEAEAEFPTSSNLKNLFRGCKFIIFCSLT